jgi:hypothetical protein
VRLTVVPVVRKLVAVHACVPPSPRHCALRLTILQIRTYLLNKSQSRCEVPAYIASSIRGCMCEFPQRHETKQKVPTQPASIVHSQRGVVENSTAPAEGTEGVIDDLAGLLSDPLNEA